MWWLLRGAGRGGGHGGGHGQGVGPKGDGTIDAPLRGSAFQAPPYQAPPATDDAWHLEPGNLPSLVPTRPEVTVMIRGGDRVDLDGQPSNLARVAIAAALARLVIVRATGEARHGFIMSVLSALISSGVSVSADMGGGGAPDLSYDLGMARRDFATAEATRDASAPL